MTRANQPFDVAVLRAKGCRIKDYIGFVCGQGAVGLIGEESPWQGNATLQPQITQFEAFVVCHAFSPALTRS